MESGPEDPQTSPAAQILAEFLTGDAPATQERFESLCSAHPAESERLRRLYAVWQRVEERVDDADVGQTLVDLMSRVDDGEPVELVPDEAARAFRNDLLERLEGRGGFERYRVEEHVAEGGQGEILRVRDGDLRRTLAMKVARDDGDPKMLARFLDEAQVTGQLDHPGIVPVHEIGLDPAGRVYFTMRYVQGRDLRSVFERVRDGREGWTRTRALGLLLRVCEAMAYAHSKGVVHRDLKPANVMVGDFGEVYVMDWGLARLEGHEDRGDLRLRAADDAELSRVRTSRQDLAWAAEDSGLVTMDGDIVGTPYYMPPEQALGQLDRIGVWSDVYCVGAMLYELLTGSVPYCEPGARKPAAHEVIARVMHRPPKPLHELAQDVPPGLQAICEKAMAREPEERYIDMRALGADLSAWLDGRVVLAHETGALAEFRSWVRRNRTTAVAIAAAILLAVVGLAVIGVTQANRRAELQVKNAQVERAIVREQEAAEAARVAAAKAREAATAAEWQAYLANVTAADMSRERGNVEDLRRHLDLCPPALRGLEWSWLALHGDSSVAVLRGHEAPVLALAGSPDGTRLASGSADRSVRLWDTATSEPLARWGDLGGTVRAVRFDPTGALVAAATQAGELVVWDAADGRERARVEGGWVGHRSVALAPDLTAVLSGSIDTPYVYLWDARTGALVRRFDGHETRVASVAFAPDGRCVASGSGFDMRYPQAVRVWDRASGDLVTAVTGLETQPVGAIAFASDGELLIAQHDLRRAVLGEAPRARPLGVVDPAAVAAAPDGSRFAVAVPGGGIELHASGGGTPVPLRGHREEVQSLVFSPRGDWVAAGANDFAIRVWDAETGVDPKIRLRGHRGPVTAIAYDPRSARVASAGAGRRVLVRDAANGVVEAAPEDPGSPAAALAFTPSGTRLAGALADGRTLLWEAASGRLVRAFDGHEPGARSLAVSPDGRWLASASTGTRGWRRGPGGGLEAFGRWDEVVRVVDLDSGELAASLDAHDSGAHALAFSPDGARLVTASASKLRAWSTRDFRLERELQAPAEAVRRLAFSADGARLACATASGDVVLCAADSLEAVATLRGHAGAVTDLAFLPGGERLVSLSLDGSLKVWDAPRAAAVATLDAGDEHPAALAVAPDGTRLVTGGETGLVRLWETDAAAVGAMWRARSRQRALEPRVAALFDRWLWCGDVLRALDADPTLDEGERRAARGLALERGDASLAEVADGVWEVLLDDGAPRERHELALEHALALSGEAPGDLDLLCGVGLGQVRTGRFAAAERTLARVDADARAATGRAHAAAGLVLALAQHDQGRAEEALRLLAESRARVGDDASARARRLLDEAERRIAGR